MLHDEFYQLTNIQVEDDVYNQFIDPMYMSTGMDKEPFCKDLKKHGLQASTVAIELTATCCEQHRTINKLEAERKELVLLLLKSAGQEDNELSRKAIKMVGHKEVIRLKMLNGWGMNDSDKAFLMDLLS